MGVGLWHQELLLTLCVVLKTFFHLCATAVEVVQCNSVGSITRWVEGYTAAVHYPVCNPNACQTLRSSDNITPSPLVDFFFLDILMKFHVTLAIGFLQNIRNLLLFHYKFVNY